MYFKIKILQIKTLKRDIKTLTKKKFILILTTSTVIIEYMNSQLNIIHITKIVLTCCKICIFKNWVTTVQISTTLILYIEICLK